VPRRSTTKPLEVPSPDDPSIAPAKAPRTVAAKRTPVQSAAAVTAPLPAAAPPVVRKPAVPKVRAPEVSPTVTPPHKSSPAIQVVPPPNARARAQPAAPPVQQVATGMQPLAGPPPRTARLSPAGALPPAYIPREALIAPRNNLLIAIAIGTSLALHGVLLALHFTMPDTGKKSSDAPMEVALVNAKTKARPTKADILAQANLDGGGNTDQDRRAKSPLPVLPKDSLRNEITVAAQRVDALEQQTKELLTQLRSSPVAAPSPKPTDQQEPTESPTANEMMQKSLEAMRLEAQIAKDMDAYQKRPKRQFVGSRAQEYRFARYVEDWRLKIERVGNLNYPAAARDRKLYGSLILTVAIRADGSVDNVEVNHSSGHRILDAAAVKIVTMSAPFAAFPPDIRRDTDILYITRTWTFTKGDALVSN
jgi:periplasmic protein TonB